MAEPVNLEEWRQAVAAAPNVRITTLRVAFALAQRVAPDGSVGVSRRDLAAAAGVSDWTARFALRQLADLGFLATEEGGIDTPNSHTLTLPGTERSSTEAEDRPHPRRGDEPRGEDTPAATTTEPPAKPTARKRPPRKKS